MDTLTTTPAQATHGYITEKDRYLARLRRIEGQARGIRRMSPGPPTTAEPRQTRRSKKPPTPSPDSSSPEEEHMKTFGRAMRSALDSSEVRVSVSRCCNAVRWVVTATTKPSNSRR
ncbi:Metal-sensitive transcriptional repressor [Amycolatopsis marina]|uniref:Metal-sensitive transcriptional repressor n=1 Tax=Amycolatopsis marina TaxID=490629 RepID=A0A1I1C363_9PSEU|nr:Metal-sensitive transcriptional repressor [Amycolatopsis marina]